MSIIKPILRKIPQPSVFPVTGVPFRMGGGSQNWSSYWLTRSLFASDGTITDNKLLNLKGDQAISPSLAESYCLQMAVDDVIAFTSLDGWSITSHGGTAVIEINGNNVLCTTGGTLYNLIMFDGTNTHYYPLAEGGYTIAYDTSADPKHGTIICDVLTWTTQDSYHKNIQGYNYRTSIDTYRQITFIDGGSGLPTGYTLTYPDYTTITTINNIVKVYAKINQTKYYHLSIVLNNVVTVGKTYRVTLHTRSDVARTGSIRFGTSTTAKNIAFYPTWNYVTSDYVVADGTTMTIMGASSVQNEGAWFEFDYIFIEEQVDGHYIPKQESNNLDADGNVISLLGNGNFIECETKLKFPDNSTYQEADDHLEFFYDLDGNQNSIGWDDLLDNVKRFDRVFCEKTDNRLTKLSVANAKYFTRSEFITYLKGLGQDTYKVYTKITNGAMVLFPLDNVVDKPYLYEKMYDRGATCVYNVNNCYDGSNAVLISNDNGVYHYGRLNFPISNICVELTDGEEDEFATQIASGDLEVFDVTGGKRGAVAKVNYPNYTTGKLLSSAKTSGTLTITEYLQGYSTVLFIPPDQLGVPVEIVGKPLWQTEEGVLMYYEWDAAEFFGVTFTTNDSINIYRINYADYGDEISISGLSCIYKHMRNISKTALGNPLVGFLESAGLGPLAHAIVSSPAVWDIGMLFGSNGSDITILSSINGNNVRDWCTFFGHHGVGNGSTLNDALAAIDEKSQSNGIICTEIETEWGDFNTVIDSLCEKCDEAGMLVLSPIDFIKNLQFND